MKTARVLCAGHKYGSASFVTGGDQAGVNHRGKSVLQTKLAGAYGQKHQSYGRNAIGATTTVTHDHENKLTTQAHSQPQYPDEGQFGSSTARRTGFLYRFPTRKYPNPKRHRPILTTHQPNLMHATTHPNTLVARVSLPLETKAKRLLRKIVYLRPVPAKMRVRKEMYYRMKFGLFDLERILPELWGPQEGFKLDRDEWLFKVLYFNHPLTESDLCEKVDKFPHNPFDDDKDVCMALERLVSREYARRLKGKEVGHPDVNPEEYYWTLMPDELAFGEKVVLEERYMQIMKEGKPLHSTIFPIRKEMLEKNYQEKHNTFSYFDEVRDVQKLEEFVEFCRTERIEAEKKLTAIGETVEFPDIPDEEVAEKERNRSYPDPPTLLSAQHPRINWHTVGHWKNSVPDGQRPEVVPNI